MPTDRLHVWLERVHVADIEKRDWNDLRCVYTDEALTRWAMNEPVLSCSLPLRPRSQAALPFLKGLLPEGHALDALAARAGVSVLDTFELLDRYGRDIAGALVIGRDDLGESRWDVEPYDPDSLAVAVGELDQNPLGVHDDSELSLPGLQNKLLLVRQPDGTWARPLHGRPSTHILKVEDRRYPGMAKAEADCLSLAADVGLTSIHAELLTAGDIPCLIVNRFDRVESKAGIRRIHQEDLCQALGINPADNRGRIKYERDSGGGPGFHRAASLLDGFAADPEAQLRRLIAATAFTVAIGNADAHAKNMSFMHPTVGTVELAALYDTVPTVLWPNLNRSFSMAVNGVFPVDAVTLDDICEEAVNWSLDREHVAATVRKTLLELRKAVETSPTIGDELATLVDARIDALLPGEAD